MAEIIDLKNKNSIQNATEVLTRGGVLVFPTDTVYGIGCSLSHEAIAKLYKIKNRPTNQPTAVLMNKDVFEDLLIRDIDLPAKIQKDFEEGKLTVILPANFLDEDFDKTIVAEDETIGVRLPKHAWLSQLIDEVGPIVASSANKKGDKTPTNFSEINSQIIDEADLTIKSEEAGVGQSSSIYHLVLKKILR